MWVACFFVAVVATRRCGLRGERRARMGSGSLCALHLAEEGVDAEGNGQIENDQRPECVEADEEEPRPDARNGYDTLCEDKPAKERASASDARL